MSPDARSRLRLAAIVGGLVVALAALAGAWGYQRLRASLPQLDGTVRLAGLSAAVTVERDALGVPRVRGRDRADVARALGWLHAQDRFFQMDLLRRSSAGELAELFGKKAVPRDRAMRLHGFRRLAQAVLARLSPEERRVIDAYTAGVNAGLGALGAVPFEYLVLRQAPQGWKSEDSLLVNYAMAIDLQEETGQYERSLMTLRDTYGAESLAFFAPLLSADDAALDGSTAPLPPIPGPGTLNLRTAKLGASPSPAHAGEAFAAQGRTGAATFPFSEADSEIVAGSNAFAVAGTHTASGGALLANDMHLGHAVPNIWYRAALEFGGRRLAGVTLPGMPFLVAGSNGDIAWGLTNALIDTGDLVVVETNSLAKSLYRAPGRNDFLTIEKRRETIQVKGDDPVIAEYDWTIWGPIVGQNDRERPLAYRWIVHDPEAMTPGLLGVEDAKTVDAAVDAARQTGITHVNFLVADRAGAVAWTLAGRVPRRVGYDGRLPVTWNFGDRRWDGQLPPEEVPVVRGGDSVLPGRVWSGNQRQIGGATLARLGDGGYVAAPRAAQIRDGLAALSRATPRDVLAVQLDDRALFLKSWHERLLATLTPAAMQANPARAELRRHAEKWEGRASVDAISYRIVREFRQAVRARVFGPIFAPCVEAMPEFSWRRFHLEPALQAVLREKPLHLLDPRFQSWDELLVAAVDDTIAAIDKSGLPLPGGTWGQRNRARIRHPFSNAFPLVGRWLDLPADPLPGDTDMPRVQSPSNGASQRLVISPGREEEGIFHMPGGQSGHPLSPFFRAGHQAWVRGEPTPLLPGPVVHRLTLQP